MSERSQPDCLTKNPKSNAHRAPHRKCKPARITSEGEKGVGPEAFLECLVVSHASSVFKKHAYTGAEQEEIDYFDSIDKRKCQ